MTDVIKFSKKAFTWSVVLMTIAWSMGLAAFTSATAVHANECPELDPGVNFTVEGGSAVYYLDANLEKRAYQHESHFRMWNRGVGEDVWAEVVELSSACADNYSLPGELPLWVGPFPGTLVTNNETANVYVVGENHMIWRVPSEEVATGFWGADVFSRVLDIFPTYWVNFDVQAEEFDGSAPLNGMLVSYDGNMYRMMDGMLYMVEGELPAGAVAQAVAATAEQWEAWAGVMADDSVTADSVVEDVAQAEGATPRGDDNDGDDEEPSADVDLTASLSAASPAGTTVPINVDNVVFTKVVVENDGDDDAQLNSLRIERSGLGATGDFTSVTVYDGAEKLGSSRTSWTSDDYMTYNIPGGLDIPANGSRVLTIEGRLDTAGTYNALGVTMMSFSDGEAGGLPVFGNEMLGVNVSVGTVTVTGQGTATQTKKIGTTDVTLAEFRLELNGTEDGYLTSVTLENKGTADPNDLRNLYLYRGSTQVAGPAQMNNDDQVVFVLDEEYMLAKSKNHDFKVKGDLVDGDTKTVEFVLDDTTDLRVRGAIYKSSMSVTATAYDAVADSGTTATTIDGAELNIAFTSNPIDTPDDRDNLEFGELTLSAGSTDVEITTLIFTIDETDGDSDATNNSDVDELELVGEDGSLYSGVMTNGGDADADDETWTFDDAGIYLTAGEPMTFTIRGDLPSGIGSDDSYRLTMTVNTTNIVAETKPGNDTVDNFSVGSITGKLVTVKAPELTVRSVDMNTDDAVINETDVMLFKGTMEASAASDLNIEQVVLEGANATAGNTNEVTNNFDEDNWSQVGFYTWDAGTESWVEERLLTSSDFGDGVLTFDSMDFDVMAGSANRVTYAVMGTLKNSFSANTTVHLQLDSVTASDDDNDAPTVQNSAGVAIADQNELEIVRTVTLRSTGSLLLSMRNNDAGYNKDRVFLAGDGMFVGKLRVKAEYEDILLRDLKLQNASADDEDNVDSICLYSDSVADAEHLIACTSLDSNDIAFFNDIDVLVSEGTHNWYIYVNSRPMGEGANATADSHDVLSFRLPASSTTGAVVARGADDGSGADLTMGDNDGTAAAGEIAYDNDLDGNFDEAGDTTTAYTKSFEMAGAKITNVDLVSSYGGESLDNEINGTGTYTVAIVKVETAGHNNTTAAGNALKLAIDEMVFDVEKHSTTTISAVTVERINGASGAATITDDPVDGTGETSGDWTFATVTTSLQVDAEIDAGETAYFVVKATIATLDTASGVEDHIRVSFDNLNSGTNNIDWIDGYAGLSGNNTDFDFLRLDKDSVTGTKISENL